MVDDTQPRWTVEMTITKRIQKVEETILEKKKQLLKMVGVFVTTIFEILHEHPGMTQVSGRRMTRVIARGIFSSVFGVGSKDK